MLAVMMMAVALHGFTRADTVSFGIVRRGSRLVVRSFFQKAFGKKTVNLLRKVLALTRLVNTCLVINSSSERVRIARLAP